MKTWIMAALAGGGGAWIWSSSATAAPVLTVVSLNTSDGFLTTNDLQSAVIGVTGFAQGENLLGFFGTTDTPWSITCSVGAFFNINTPFDSSFDPQGQYAASPAIGVPGAGFDSGTLGAASALGDISTSGASNPIGFAQFGVGNTSGAGDDVFWLNISLPNGIPVPGTMNLFRLTWSRTASATVSMLLITQLDSGGIGDEFPVSITIPAIPTPGATTLLAVIDFAGNRGRRVC